VLGRRGQPIVPEQEEHLLEARVRGQLLDREAPDHQLAGLAVHPRETGVSDGDAGQASRDVGSGSLAHGTSSSGATPI
jgi:hypothetical protein